MPSKRVLTLTFEFHVPEGLRHDVRTTRVKKAVERITDLVSAVSADAFPWADKLVVTHEWSYRWFGDSTPLELPKSATNTVEAE